MEKHIGFEGVNNDSDYEQIRDENPEMKHIPINEDEAGDFDMPCEEIPFNNPDQMELF